MGFTCSVLPLVWFAYLLFERGPHAIYFFARSSLKGAVNLSKTMALPLPSFNPAEPLSPSSIVVLAYTLVIVTYLILRRHRARRRMARPSSPRSRFLLALALVGSSIFHQGFHRKDTCHLIQVIPPASMGSGVLIAMFYRTHHELDLKGTAVSSRSFPGLDVCAGHRGRRLGLGSLWPRGLVGLRGVAPAEASRAGASTRLWHWSKARRSSTACARSARRPIATIRFSSFRLTLSISPSLTGR